MSNILSSFSPFLSSHRDTRMAPNSTVFAWRVVNLLCVVVILWCVLRVETNSQISAGSSACVDPKKIASTAGHTPSIIYPGDAITPVFHDTRLKDKWNSNVPYMGQGGEAFGPERPYWFLNAIVMVDTLLARGANIGTHFAVNVGSTGSDVAIELLRNKSWPGVTFDIVFEGVPIVSPFVRKVTLGLNPENVANAFLEQSIPRDLALLKIDIDGYDCDVMEALFAAGFDPSILIMELNAGWPPPLRYKTSYTPEFRPDPCLYGCSLQYAFEFLTARGYVLIQYPFEDGWFVKAPLAPHFGDIPHDAATCYDAGNPGAQWGGCGLVQRHWLDAGRERTSRPALLREVWADVNERIAKYPSGHFMHQQPFTLGVSLE